MQYKILLIITNHVNHIITIYVFVKWDILKFVQYISIFKSKIHLQQNWLPFSTSEPSWESNKWLFTQIFFIPYTIKGIFLLLKFSFISRDFGLYIVSLKGERGYK